MSFSVVPSGGLGVGAWTLKIDKATQPFLGLSDKVKNIVTRDMALS